MKESVEKLFKKMNEDREFSEKILSQTEKEKVIEIAKREGIELSFDDMDEVNKIIKNLKAKKDGELSEEELERVAGGTGGTFGTLIM